MKKNKKYQMVTNLRKSDRIDQGTMTALSPTLPARLSLL